MDATHLASTAPESDPTLSSLVPQRSTRRNLLLASAVLLLLVGGWTSPHMLRPSVMSSGSTFGIPTTLARQHQVLTTVQLSPAGWPNVGVHSMGDLPGARVAGAWVVPGTLAQSRVTDPADYSTGLDYLRASFPQADFGQASRLPHRLDPGESAQLVILWDITDCSLLTQDPRPQIELTSILGTTTHEQLPPWVAPLSVFTIQPGNNICPTP